MRGCLAVLVLAAVFSVAAIWLAGPPIASGLVTIGLRLAGFEAEQTTVTVTTDPPTDLLTGRADEVRIRAADASFGGLTASSVDLVLVDVGLLDRSAGTVRGRLDGIVVGRADERLAVSSIEIDGVGDEAAAVARVSAGAIEALAARSIETAIGAAPDAVTLVAPDLLAFSVAGASAQAQLAVDDDGNVVALGIPGAAAPIILVAAASADPFQLDAVAVERTELVVRGKLDVTALLR